MQRLTFAIFFAFSVTWGLTGWAEATTMASQHYHPTRHLEQTLKDLIQRIDNRQRKELSSSVTEEPLQVSIPARRNEFLQALYDIQLLEASTLSRKMADKLIVAKLADHYLGEAARHWHPKTLGLKEFLIKNQLVNENGNITGSKPQVHQALAREFPMGNIVKPAAGMNSAGKGKGFYFNRDEFIDDLLDADSPLYSQQQFQQPFRPKMIEHEVASGEFLILQENVIKAAGINRDLKAKEFVEIRVHTLEDKVIPGATYSRWKEVEGVPKEDFLRAEKFVGGFLEALPQKLTAHQAWSLDVAVLDNGVLRIIEINTNRGKPHHWSGFLSRPGLLGQYTRYIEAHYPIHFAGLSGFLMRNGLGNIKDYLEKKYIEESL